jgi:hypothetical protein
MTTKLAVFQEFSTGATGLEPATSGVTGLLHRYDDWRRLTRYRSIHATCGPLRADLCTVAYARFRAFAALLLSGNGNRLFAVQELA